MQKAILYKKIKNDDVQCVCCNHKCVISPGKCGICGVRQNVGGELYLRVYGKAIAVHIDPVEKKPFYHFLPGTKMFSFGTIGCNFRCSFCQNWDISQAKGKDCDMGQDLPPEEIVSYCRENKIPSIAYTYNEPTIFTEYAADTGKLAKKHGIKNVYVTNGYESEECLEYMKDWCDALNIDIKSYSERFYSKICGARLQPVLDTVKRAWEMGFWVEITTLVIPGENDSKRELKSIAEFIAGVSVDIPWHVTAFHPDYKMTDVALTPASTLERAWKIGKEAGLKFVYTGNIPGMEHDNTFCPKCNTVLVERYGMECLKCNVEKGKCPKCGEKIAGVWE